jgi:hypothetical protein
MAEPSADGRDILQNEGLEFHKLLKTRAMRAPSAFMPVYSALGFKIAFSDAYAHSMGQGCPIHVLGYGGGDDGNEDHVEWRKKGASRDNVSESHG